MRTILACDFLNSVNVCEEGWGGCRYDKRVRKQICYLSTLKMFLVLRILNGFPVDMKSYNVKLFAGKQNDMYMHSVYEL